MRFVPVPKRFLFAAVTAASVACSSGGTSSTGPQANSDAGPNDGGSGGTDLVLPASCAKQPEGIAKTYCAERQDLFVCEASGGTPPPPCLRAAVTDGYCCPTQLVVPASALIVCSVQGPVSSFTNTLRYFATFSSTGNSLQVTLNMLKQEALDLRPTSRVGSPIVFPAAAFGESYSSTVGEMVIPIAALQGEADAIVSNYALTTKSRDLRCFNHSGRVTGPSSGELLGGCLVIQATESATFELSSSLVKVGNVMKTPKDLDCPQ